jgi:hypothetical protein
MPILLLWKWFGRLTRKIFGPRVPSYISDLWGLIAYVNFFRLIPTFYMILFEPDHFFKSVPQIVSGKKKLYTTPIKFFSNIITLQLLVAVYMPDSAQWPTLDDVLGMMPRFGLSEHYDLFLTNLLLALLSPLVIAAASIIILVTWYIAAGFWLTKSIVADMKFNYHGPLLVLSPDTYRNLDFHRYCWSMLYFYWYFYLVFPLILFCFISAIVGVFYVHLDLEGGRHIHFNAVTYTPYVFVCLIFSIVAYYAFVPKYASLLLASSRTLSTRAVCYLYVKMQSEMNDSSIEPKQEAKSGRYY